MVVLVVYDDAVTGHLTTVHLAIHSVKGMANFWKATCFHVKLIIFRLSFTEINQSFSFYVNILLLLSKWGYVAASEYAVKIQEKIRNTDLSLERGTRYSLMLLVNYSCVEKKTLNGF